MEILNPTEGGGFTNIFIENSNVLCLPSIWEIPSDTRFLLIFSTSNIIVLFFEDSNSVLLLTMKNMMMITFNNQQSHQVLFPTKNLMVRVQGEFWCAFPSQKKLMDASFGSVDPHIGASSPILNVWILPLAWGGYVFSLYMCKLPSFYLESVWLPQSQWCIAFSSMEGVVANIWNAWLCPPKKYLIQPRYFLIKNLD